MRAWRFFVLSTEAEQSLATRIRPHLTSGADSGEGRVWARHAPGRGRVSIVCFEWCLEFPT